MEITQGTRVQIPFRMLAASGAPLSLTSSDRSLVLRFTLVGGSSTTLTRTTGSAGQYQWTDQASGTGDFLIPAATNVQATLPLGTYELEVKYADVGASDIQLVYQGRVTVVAPKTGTF